MTPLMRFDIFQQQRIFARYPRPARGGIQGDCQRMTLRDQFVDEGSGIGGMPPRTAGQTVGQIAIGNDVVILREANVSGIPDNGVFGSPEKLPGQIVNRWFEHSTPCFLYF